MAKLSQKVLGTVSGTLGDITFRQRNGKNYLATRPQNFNAPMDQASLERRSRFALAVKLASIFNSIPLIKTIWASKTPAGSTVYNYLVKTNYKLLDGDKVNESTLLLPSLGFGIILNSLSLERTDIGVVIEAIGTRAGISLIEEPNLQLISILCLSSPTDENLERTFLIPLVSDEQPTLLEGQLTFNLSLSSQESQLFDRYSVKNIIFGIVTLNSENNPVHYSSTIYG